jgi:hypothetical protein
VVGGVGVVVVGADQLQLRAARSEEPGAAVLATVRPLGPGESWELAGAGCGPWSVVRGGGLGTWDLGPGPLGSGSGGRWRWR